MGGWRGGRDTPLWSLILAPQPDRCFVVAVLGVEGQSLQRTAAPDRDPDYALRLRGGALPARSRGRRSTIMKRAAVISPCLVSFALIVACNRHDEQADTSKKSIVDLATHPPAPVVPTPVVVTGCLMGAGTEFIIATPDRSQEGSNIVYELTNAGDQLIVLVVQKVRVTGEAEPIQVA